MALLFPRTLPTWLVIVYIALPGQSANALQPSTVPGQFDAVALSGRFRNVVVYAPMPVVPASAQHLSGRGLYVVELVNGNVEDVRVVKSTGYKVLDDAAIVALRQWRFKPHVIWKSHIPIEFHTRKEQPQQKSDRASKP